MEHIFLELTLIIGLASGLSIFFRYLKQPPILAYILTGIIIGPLALFKIESGEVIESLAQIGITLLLFMLGLEMRFQELKSVGKVALLTGIGQIIFTSAFGYLICLALGFSPLTSLYLSIALTFSSTIIVVKLLSDKKDLKSLYGKIAVGVLLIQDFVAIIALIILSGFNTGGSQELSPMTFLLLMLKAIVLIGWIIVLSNTLLPKMINHISKNSEILFLFSLAWAFGMAALVSSSVVGFSIEIGGFLAGLALANSAQNFQIVAKVRSLRDFFITLFFVTLGMRMMFDSFFEIVIPSLLLSIFVLIGNPLIVMVILGILGYRKRTSFMAGLTVAQISEFSLIVMFMGYNLGHVSDKAISIITLVGAITFVVSTYMIMGSNPLFKVLAPVLQVFERKNAREKRIEMGELKDHIVLVGANRMGESILEALHQKSDSVVVVDFDPDVIKRLGDQGTLSVFGDITDIEIQEHIGLTQARLIISTVPDVDDNLQVIHSIRKVSRKIMVVVFALEGDDAKALYDAGADYVVLPHLAGGHHLAKILINEDGLEMIERFKKSDLTYLE